MTLNVLVSLDKMGPRGIAQVVVVKVLKDPPRQRDLWPSSTGVLILLIIIIILQVAA